MKSTDLIFPQEMLFPHEFRALLEALRRDLHSELSKGMNLRNDIHFHKQNARQIVRLLEILNPRRPNRERVGSLHTPLQFREATEPWVGDIG